MARSRLSHLAISLALSAMHSGQLGSLHFDKTPLFFFLFRAGTVERSLWPLLLVFCVLPCSNGVGASSSSAPNFAGDALSSTNSGYILRCIKLLTSVEELGVASPFEIPRFSVSLKDMSIAF